MFTKMIYSNLWDDQKLKDYLPKDQCTEFQNDMGARIYSSRLIGNVPDLVMHGGGNTSCKSKTQDLHGNEIKIICVKGSGWDLGNIEAQGMPALKLDPLCSMRSLEELSDEDMVNIQRSNLLDYKSPNPSVETLLHAFLPHKFIDHTHSTPFLTLANLPDAKSVTREIFKSKLAIVPYIMPGFQLAKLASQIHDENPDIEGLLLLQHGHFTWGDTAKQSYERVISHTQAVEKWLSSKRIPRKVNILKSDINQSLDFIQRLRSALTLSEYADGKTPIFHLENNTEILEFLQRNDLDILSKSGVATPDHVIRLKPNPLILKGDSKESDIKKKVNDFSENYKAYFEKYAKKETCKKYMISPLPKVIWAEGVGLIGVGASKNEAKIITQLASQNIKVMSDGMDAGGYKPVNLQHLFDLEYWSLEQAKIGNKKPLKLQGKIVVITGAAGAIGKQIAKTFAAQGAEILLVDNNVKELEVLANELGVSAASLEVDLTNPDASKKIISQVISCFGGADILISNAGYAPQGPVADIEERIVRESFELNFFTHFRLAREFFKVFKTQKFGGQILFNVSKQAVNPGKNFSAYGLPKATLLFLLRQLALEFGDNDVRVNGVNADRIRSGILTDKVISERAKSRSIKEEDYMTANLLNKEVEAYHVAEAFLSLACSERTTGHVITVDGGNVAAFLR